MCNGHISRSEAEQFNGREGETATLLSTGLLNSELRGGGFAPRHLSRSVFLLIEAERAARA